MTRRQKRTSARLPSRVRRVFLAFFVITFSFWTFVLFYTLPMQISRWRISSLEILLYSPRYLSVGEENAMRIALENTDVTPVNATIRLVNNGPTAGFLGAETNIFYSGIVEGKEQINDQLLVFIPLTPAVLGHVIEMGLEGDIGETPWEEELQLHVAPLPKIKSIAKYLNGIFAAMFGSAVGLINDVFRPFLQPVRKKK